MIYLRKKGRDKLVRCGRKQTYEKTRKKGVGQIRGTRKILTYLEASHGGVGESRFLRGK